MKSITKNERRLKILYILWGMMNDDINDEREREMMKEEMKPLVTNKNNPLIMSNIVQTHPPCTTIKHIIQ